MNPQKWYSGPRIVRCFLAVVGTFAWLCAAVVIQQGLLIGSRSPLLWGTAATGLLAGLGAWGASLRMSHSQIETAQRQLAAFLDQDQPVSEDTVSRLWGGRLVVCGGLLFAINTVWVSRHQDTPDDDDQGAFLITAREIHARGGITQLWSDLWSGRFEESNRHPLLLAIQSLHPTDSFARAASIALAGVTFGITLALVWHRLGPLTAGLLSVLLATNGAWLYHAPRMVCESLLTGLAGLLWLMFYPPREPVQSETSPPLKWQRSLWAGGLAGLVYLTKGTGLLLFAGAGLAFLVMSVTPSSQRRHWLAALASFTLAFVVVASPLLVRNAIRFGSPTYNINSYLLWVDTYESPNDMAEKMTLQGARATYLATHTPLDMLKREATGLAWEAFIGLRTLGPAPWNDSRLLFGVPLFVLGLLGLSQTPQFPAWVLILWTGIVWGAMAWYVPIAAGDRFVMPLLIPWLTLAANGLVRISHTTSDASSANRRIAIIALLWGVTSTAFVWTRSELWNC